MADTPTSKPDVFVYHPLDELERMSLAEVEALWELVPTERQRTYKAIYDRTRRDEGASGSDHLEISMIQKLLSKYREKALIPLGAYWVSTPTKIQQVASTSAPLVKPETPEAQTAKKPSAKLMLLGAGCLLVFGFLFVRNLGNRNSKVAVVGTGTITPTLTATLLHTPTPTPFALDAQDSIIRGGDTSSSGQLFPVNLRVMLGSEKQPRIFIIQRRLIQTTEWNFDDNPDTASYISGLTVRPVLGIPWSDENVALFNAMSARTNFVLQMNTGASLKYQFAARQVVNRSDTSLFRQVAPGLVLALIGQRDPETKESTPDRIIVLADYVADQELSSGVLTGITLPTAASPTPTLTPTPVQRLDVQLIAAESAQGFVRVRLRIYNGQYIQTQIDSRSIWIIYGYTERPIGPHVAAEIAPFSLEPGQAVDLKITFAWHGEPFATLGILDDYQFALGFAKGSS